MHITMLGTGNASATECYNSCFLLTENGKHLLVDGGGGSNIFKQLNLVGIDWKTINRLSYFKPDWIDRRKVYRSDYE